jgi:hypothetical protein
VPGAATAGAITLSSEVSTNEMQDGDISTFPILTRIPCLNPLPRMERSIPPSMGHSAGCTREIDIGISLVLDEE